jgi:arylamine N-acetyltransferase
MLDGGIVYDRSGKITALLDNKRQAFSIDYAARLQKAQIECRDALQIIQSRNVQTPFSTSIRLWAQIKGITTAARRQTLTHYSNCLKPFKESSL